MEIIEANLKLVAYAKVYASIPFLDFLGRQVSIPIDIFFHVVQKVADRTAI